MLLTSQAAHAMWPMEAGSRTGSVVMGFMTPACVLVRVQVQAHTHAGTCVDVDNSLSPLDAAHVLRSTCASAAHHTPLHLHAGPSMTHSNVYVKGLPLECDEQTLSSLFQPHGTISSLRLFRQPNKPPFAFVKFAEVHEAQQAISSLNGASFWGSIMEVRCVWYLHLRGHLISGSAYMVEVVVITLTTCSKPSGLARRRPSVGSRLDAGIA